MTFNELQSQLEAEMNALRARGVETRYRVEHDLSFLTAHTGFSIGEMQQAIAKFNSALRSLAYSFGKSSDMANLGRQLLGVSPEERRQLDMSDWLFNLHYKTLDRYDHLWWITYYPALWWEKLVMRLPLWLFRKM